MYVGTFCAFGGEVPIGCKYIGTALQARINDIIIMAEWSFIMRGRGIFIHTDGMTCRCHASRPVVAPLSTQLCHHPTAHLPPTTLPYRS